MAPFYELGSTVSRLQCHNEVTVYILLLFLQELLVLIWSTSEVWKAKLTLDPTNGFDPGFVPMFIEELNIKGPFTTNKLQAAIKRIRNGKACGLDEIPGEVWKLEEFHPLLLHCCNSVYNQNLIDRWIEGCLLPFHKKGDLSVAMNFREITNCNRCKDA